MAGYIGECLDEVDAKVATLSGTGWEGVAAQAYVDAHVQWLAGARAFAEGVRDMSDAARVAHARYTRAVETNHKMFNGG
ncbi:hypothetical protein NFA_4855 [Nocardia farcinica IFM 10152]|uniref:WXG100 family type VII secretion target n=1 Tax=Nocardia farcinica (strain IFM 10152) TaxID=247156 RepID=Q5Z2L3_NOCFA|nr:hypothetical protein NFA_4855 [Nocardia farcinica IFM 10152]